MGTLVAPQDLPAPTMGAGTLVPPQDVPSMPSAASPDPTQGMGWWQTAGATANKTLRGMGTGAYERMLEILSSGGNPETGVPSSPELQAGWQKQLAQTQADVTAQRARDQSLMNRPGATTGEVAANALPWLALRAASLPASTALGTAQGLLQPTGIGESPWSNAALGAVGGAAGQQVGSRIVGPMLSGAWNAAKGLFAPGGEMAATAAESTLPSATPYAQSKTAQRVVQAYAADAKNVAQGTYQAAASAPGADALFPADKFFAKAGPVLNTYGDFLPGVVKARLQQLQAGGILSDSSAAALPESANMAARPFTVGEAANLYQLINDTTGGVPGKASIAGSALKKALAEAGSDIPGEPGTAMRLFQDATQQWRTMKESLAPPPIKSLANISETSDVSPQFLTRLWQSGKPEEIRSLFSFMQANEPGSQQVVHDSLISYLSRRAAPSGPDSFSPSLLTKAIAAVGPERMATVLSPQELAQLNELGGGGGTTLSNLFRGLHLPVVAGGVLGHFAEPAMQHLLPIPGAGVLAGMAIGKGTEALAQAGRARQAATLQQLLNPTTLQQPIPIPLLTQLAAQAGGGTGMGLLGGR